MDVFAVHFCPQCGQPQALARPMTRVECSRCNHRDIAPLTAWLDRDKWASGQHTTRMFVCLAELGIDLTPRKARLISCAAARTQLASAESDKLRNAIELSEEWADTGTRPAHAVRLREQLSQLAWALGQRYPNVWAWIGEQCLLDNVEVVVREHQIPELLAPILRDMFPNPFIPLTWDPEWLTTTVYDLARHIYTKHDFSAMPVLADALQDAGCDDEQVLNHCRASKEHARGCWVLDAIRGVS